MDREDTAGEGHHYFLGGQAGVSFAYVTEMRTDCDWLQRPLFILLLLRNTLGRSSYTHTPSSTLLSRRPE